MARAIIENKPPVALHISNEEAIYLKKVLQNPYLYPEDANAEPSEESVLRSDLWVALDEVLVR